MVLVKDDTFGYIFTLYKSGKIVYLKTYTYVPLKNWINSIKLIRTLFVTRHIWDQL